jgi:hypothetical protein
MNCRECQERITLDAVSAEIERHLETCAGCREFRAGLYEVLALLAETHQQAPGESQLAAVRERVRRRISAGRRRWVPVWAGGLAAAIVLLALWVGQRHERPLVSVTRSEPQVPSEPRPSGSGPLPKPATPIPKRARKPPVTPPPAEPRVRSEPRPLGSGPLQTPPAEPLTVKLITDDPNVVIYWIINAKED